MEAFEHPFFGGLPPGAAAELIAKGSCRTYAPGELIFDEGTSAKEVILVLDGTLELCKKVAADRYLPVSYTVAGACLGELGVLTGQPRSLRAQSSGPARLLHLPADVVWGFLSSLPGPASQMIINLAVHLQRTTEKSVASILKMEKLSTIGEMTGRMIHDFKNPVSVIGWCCEMIREEHPTDQTVALCTQIRNQARRMVEMMEEVRDFTRGQQRLDLQPTSLPEFFAEFRTSHRTFFDNPKVSIDMGSEPIAVSLDQGRLMRALQNLVGNAIEALEGRKDARIEVRARLDGEDAVLTVADNGPGIPETIRATLFEPFVTSGKKHGMGLGTAIVKSAVEAHGGTIRFATETGRGTTFFLTFPGAKRAADSTGVA
jgi:signal transduction histidine kinase